MFSDVPHVTIVSARYIGNSGNIITLECHYTSNPAVTSVYWTRIVNNRQTNINMISSRYAGSTITSPSLIIFSLVSSDEGYYLCSAINSVGTGHSNISYLNVTGGMCNQ